MQARLGIPGLPAQFQRLAGGKLYGIVAESATLRLPVTARTLADNLDAGLSCALATPLQAAALLHRTDLLGIDLREAVRDGRLSLLGQSDASAAPGSLPQWMRRLTRVLSELVLPPGSLIVVDEAERALGVRDAATFAATLDALQSWAQRRRHVVLAMFGARLSSTARDRAGAFDGLAKLSDVRGTAVWESTQWPGGARGRAASGRIELAEMTASTDSDATPDAAQAPQPGAQTLAHGDPSPRVDAPAQADPFAPRDPLARQDADALARQDALAREQGLVTRRAAHDFGGAAHWRVVENLTEAAEQARELAAGTVVLHFDRAGSLRDVARTVAAIRALGRPQLRVVVRETGARLRLPQLVALVRLGMALVIPRDVAGASARLVAESLRGSLTTRAADSDVDRVLEESKADAYTCPMRIDHFRARVEDLLAMSAGLDMPHTLVRFSLATQTALRPIQASLRRGARDVVFAEHDGGLWVFLFGCASEHASLVMSRLLGARFVSLMVGWQATGGHDAIRQQLLLLDHAVVEAAQAEFTDTVVLAPASESVPAEPATTRR